MPSTRPGLPLLREDVERITREILRARVPGLAPVLRVDASARHCHLCRGDMDALFGKGSERTVCRELSQPGNYAANETVTIIGPRSRVISNLRVLGPLRKRSQVELAFTDAIMLGIDAPIRLSGDIDATAGCFLMGPKGMVELKEGVIRAAIHAHMSPGEAAYFGVKHKDLMKLRVGGAASVVFERVQVRVDPATRLNVH